MTDSTISKIVYIEDDPEIISLVEIILSKIDANLICTSDSKNSIELIRRELPDVILLDLMLPDMDGWDIYKELNQYPETKDIPVVIISAKSEDIDKVLGLHIAKANDYISKPFHPEELIKTVSKFLSTKNG